MLNSRTQQNSVSSELMQAEQRVRYLGALPECPGRLPTDALNFLQTNPLIEINTGKFFDLLSYLYDENMEKGVYEDILFALENSKR